MSAATTIADALRRICRLEGDPTDTDALALSITSPIATSVKKVWPYYPPASQVVTSTPCFVNTVSPVQVLFEAGVRRVDYSVRARLVCYDANSDQTAKIAEAFWQPIIDRFGAHIKLSGLHEWHLRSLRFNGEQPVLFQDLSEAAGKTLLGLDFFIDITHTYSQVNEAGAAPSWA